MNASMTRKHFEALAAALREVFPGAESEQEIWQDCTYQVAAVCARFNPNFDRARFLAACGVQEN